MRVCVGGNVGCRRDRTRVGRPVTREIFRCMGVVDVTIDYEIMQADLLAPRRTTEVDSEGKDAGRNLLGSMIPMKVV